MDEDKQQEIARKIHEINKDSAHYKKQLAKTEKAKVKGQNLMAKVQAYKSN